VLFDFPAICGGEVGQVAGKSDSADCRAVSPIACAG
jgi:hypothetical protein